MNAFFRAVDRIGMEEFQKIIASADACSGSDLVLRALNI